MTNWNEAKEQTRNEEARIREAAEDLRDDALETAAVLRREVVGLEARIREGVKDLVADIRASAVERRHSLEEARRRDG